MLVDRTAPPFYLLKSPNRLVYVGEESRESCPGNQTVTLARFPTRKSDPESSVIITRPQFLDPLLN